MPNNWPTIIQILEGYTLLLHNIVIRWESQEGMRYKYNIDGSSLSNNGLSSKTFCVRDGQMIWCMLVLAKLVLFYSWF